MNLFLIEEDRGKARTFVKDMRVTLVSPNSKAILIQMGDTHKETDVLLD